MRSSSCCASVTWVCCCTRFALRLVEARCACWTCACAFFERGLEIARIHACDDLARRDHVALVDEELRDPAGELGVVAAMNIEGLPHGAADRFLVCFENTVPPQFTRASASLHGKEVRTGRR